MVKIQSLDDLISKKAVEFADQIKAAAAMADKEEEIRIEAEKQLAFIQKEAGIKLEGKHEFTVASGRIDSVYDRVIIEYKNPADAGARIGSSPKSPGARKVVEQIKKRFYDMRNQHRQPLNTLFHIFRHEAIVYAAKGAFARSCFLRRCSKMKTKTRPKRKPPRCANQPTPLGASASR